MRDNRSPQSRTPRTSEFDERVIEIRRVSKKTKGGNMSSFAALVVVGDRKGSVGLGYGKAKDVAGAVAKSIAMGKRDLFKVKTKDGTIAHEVSEKYGASKVLLMPAPKGSGIIAGGAVRIVAELACIKDISGKLLGSNNKIGNLRCTMNALKKLKG